MTLQKNPCEQCIVTSMCLEACREYCDYVWHIVEKEGVSHSILISKKIRRAIDKKMVKSWGRPYDFNDPLLTIVKYNIKGTITKAYNMRPKRKHKGKGFKHGKSL